jgi:hypothetical protein
MNNMLNGLRFNYNGYRLPKQRLPKESVLYHICSAFFALLTYVLLRLLDVEGIMSAASSLASSLIVYVSLFYAHNRICSLDRSIIEELVAVQKIDTIDLINRFYSQVQQSFAAEGIPYFGCATADAEAVDIDPLFSRIFRDAGQELALRFRAQAGSFSTFVLSLSQIQRELLYRHYLNDQAQVVLEIRR